MAGDHRPHVDGGDPAVLDHHPAVNDGDAGAGRRAEDGGRHRVVERPGVVDRAEVEAEEVGALPGLERADVVAAQHPRAAERRELERLAGAHPVPGADLALPAQARARGGRGASPGAPRAACSRRRCSRSRPRPGPPRRPPQVLLHRRDARGEPHVRARAVRDAAAGAGEAGDLRVAHVDGVGEPDVARHPARARPSTRRAARRSARACSAPRRGSPRGGCGGARRARGRGRRTRAGGRRSPRRARRGRGRCGSWPPAAGRGSGR